MAVSLSDSPPSQGPSCPVCYRDYSDSEQQLIPRILQCGHTYCSECLDRLLNTEQDEDDYQQIVLNIRYAGREWTTTRNYPRSRYSSNELKCPTCMTMNPVQNKDVSSLTKNFALLGCLQQPPQRHKHFCRDHDHEKRIYCCDCKTLICAYCQLYGGHSGHNYEVATEASKPSVAALKEVESGIIRDLEKLGNGKKEVCRTVRKLVRTRSKCERNVKEYFETAVKKLESEKNRLLMQISSWTEEQKYILDAQQEMLTKSCKELKSLQTNCQSLIQGDPLDALTGRQKVEEEVQRVQSQVDSLSLQPLIHPWMKAKVQDKEVSHGNLQSIVDNFKLTYDTDTGSAKKKGDETEEEPAGGEMATARNTDDESDRSSRSSSVTDDTDVLPDFIPDRHQVYEPTEGHANACSDSGRCQATLYSQESHTSQNSLSAIMGAASSANVPPNPFSIGPGREPSTSSMPHAFSIGHDLNWVSAFNQRAPHHHERSMGHIFSRGLSRESESTGSDAEDARPHSLDLPGYRLPSSRMMDQRLLRESSSSNNPNIPLGSPSMVLEVGTDDSDREQTQTQSGTRQSPGLSLEGRFEPASMHRHWEFLNDRMRDVQVGGAVGGASAKEHDQDNEDDEDEEMTALQSLIYDPSAHSPPPSEDSSPSPRSFMNSSTNDFAYPHHLALPGDAEQEDDEVVFPIPLFSWTRRRPSNPLQLNMLDILDDNYDNSNDEEDAPSDSED